MNNKYYIHIYSTKLRRIKKNKVDILKFLKINATTLNKSNLLVVYRNTIKKKKRRETIHFSNKLLITRIHHYLFIIIIIINYLLLEFIIFHFKKQKKMVYRRILEQRCQSFQLYSTATPLKSVNIRLYIGRGNAKSEENDSRCLSCKDSFHRMGPYVTRLFFAINGPTRVHEEDELVKRLDNEVEVSIEARDKSQGQPRDRHRGEVDDYRGGGFSRLEGRFSPRVSRPPSFYGGWICSIIF